MWHRVALALGGVLERSIDLPLFWSLSPGDLEEPTAALRRDREEEVAPCTPASFLSG